MELFSFSVLCILRLQSFLLRKGSVRLAKLAEWSPEGTGSESCCVHGILFGFRVFVYTCVTLEML